MTGRVAARVNTFRTLLADADTRLEDVQGLCFTGIPDSDGLRARCWKILLQYTPVRAADAAQRMARARDVYYEYIDATVTGPPPQGATAAEPDHPLSVEPESRWQGFFRDNEVLKQVDRDVRRTLPAIGLMQAPVGVANAHMRARPHVPFLLMQRMYGEGMRTSKVPPAFPIAGPAEAELHWQALERILYIYAKLNPGIGYIQGAHRGLNDIVAPIYYVFITDPDPEARLYAEADAFHCFLALMGDLRSLYMKSVDNTTDGVQSVMTQLMQRLKRKDFELWFHLDDQELHPQFYSFRWLTLLFSQEFELPDVLRLWDSIFAVDDRLDFVLDVCCAMLTCVRASLLQNELADNLELLQRYPITDVAVILDEALRLKRVD